MFLKDKKSGNLIEVLSISNLIDPFQAKVAGRFHAGEEMPEPSNFEKADLIFPSDEALPRCWVDAKYRE